jgi:DNA polymerase
MPADASHLLQHLQNAVFGYGSDLLLAVPSWREDRRGTAAAADSAADAAPVRGAEARDEGPVVPRRMPWQREAAGATTARTTIEAAQPPVALHDAESTGTTASERATQPISQPLPPRPASRPIPAAAMPVSTPAAAELPDDPLLRLRAQAMTCRKCGLCESRKSVVFGEGNRNPDVLFVGEAPGAVEDQTGRPFVGPAGQLLDKILDGAMGMKRSDVYIANINKCRPPGNRDPQPEEVAACLPFLKLQVELLRPKVIVALGRIAAHNLLGTEEPMRDLRGRDLHYEGIPVVVTWHPAFLLRDPSRKPETWQDIKRVNRMLGRPEDPRRATTTEA